MTGVLDVSSTRARIVEEVCSRIAAGESVRGVFAEPGDDYPEERTFWRWLSADPALDSAYERATARRGEKYAEEVVDIVDSAGSPLIVDGEPVIGRDGRVVMVVDRVAVEHAKLRADKRQWAAARMLPKRYGDRTVIAGDADHPVHFIDDSAVAGKLLPELASGSAPGTSGETDPD